MQNSVNFIWNILKNLDRRGKKKIYICKVPSQPVGDMEHKTMTACVSGRRRVQALRTAQRREAELRASAPGMRDVVSDLLCPAWFPWDFSRTPLLSFFVHCHCKIRAQIVPLKPQCPGISGGSSKCRFMLLQSRACIASPLRGCLCCSWDPAPSSEGAAPLSSSESRPHQCSELLRIWSKPLKSSRLTGLLSCGFCLDSLGSGWTRSDRVSWFAWDRGAPWDVDVQSCQTGMSWSVALCRLKPEPLNAGQNNSVKALEPERRPNCTSQGAAHTGK